METLEGTADKEGEIVPASELMPELEWSDEATLGFVMASKGYPGSYEKGFEITGFDDALSDPSVRIYHMGTKSAEMAGDASSGGSTASLRSAPPLASQSEAPVPPLTVPRVAWVEPARLASTAYKTSGGRVLMVVGSGKDLREARDKALAAVRKIKCENLFFRTDIGHWVL